MPKFESFNIGLCCVCFLQYGKQARRLTCADAPSLASRALGPLARAVTADCADRRLPAGPLAVTHSAYP